MIEVRYKAQTTTSEIIKGQEFFKTQEEVDGFIMKLQEQYGHESLVFAQRNVK